MTPLVSCRAFIARATPAIAQVSLVGVRARDGDPAAIGMFYRRACGVQEIQRIETPQMLEIMIDFNATPAGAKANGYNL
jgi:hypothetical protein